MMDAKVVKALIPAAVLVLALAGCGEVNQNAKKGSRDTGPADIINFPNGFRNVAHKCDGPNMIYVTSHEEDAALPSTIAVVANDPRCTK